MKNEKKADIRWDENAQPISKKFNDVYFSKENGLNESRYVFVEHNQLESRFKGLASGEDFVIAETGFGTGLNFLCTWQLWRATAKPGTRLHFISVEKFPLDKTDLQRALSLWPELAPLIKQLVQQYPPVDARGFHRIHFTDNVCLTLIFEDAIEGLNQLLPIANASESIAELAANWSTDHRYSGYIDAWFLDGFAPAKNPDMWSDALYTLMATLSKADRSTVATFTAAGFVKRGLQNVGFTMSKTPGFGKKREMLVGVYSKSDESLDSSVQPAPSQTIKPDSSWHLASPAYHDQLPPELIVIGGGLAGCQTALSAANKGFKVTLLEQDTLASGASGNPRGIVYSKLSASDGAFAEFNLSAYLYAERLYQHRGCFEQVGSDCGVLQLAQSEEGFKKLMRIAERYVHSSSFVQLLSSVEASQVAGVELEYGGLFFPGSGWFNPPKLCEYLTRHKNITIIENTQVATLELSPEGSQADRSHRKWLALSGAGKVLARGASVVIACAHSASKFSQCSALPTQAIRGQISLLSATEESHPLKTVLCGEGYIIPETNGEHCAGASFNLKSDVTELSATDHRSNLSQAQAMSPSLRSLTEPRLSKGRVSFRCATPDYLPIIGAVPKAEAFLENFSAYRRNAKQLIDKTGQYWPGLYLNIGHGSKGLCYTPICAELIMSMISNTPLPLPRRLALHLHPARFLVRDLMRNKV